jgi:hypothetical protein
MRKIKLLTFAAGIITLMSCLPAMAQVKVDFKTTFSFYAGSEKLPAGAYTLRQQPDNPSGFEIQNAAGTHSAMVMGRPSMKTTTGAPQIVFNRYGTTEYLAGVLTANGSSVDLETSEGEKTAAKKGSPQTHNVPGK